MAHFIKLFVKFKYLYDIFLRIYFHKLYILSDFFLKMKIKEIIKEERVKISIALGLFILGIILIVNNVRFMPA